MSTKAVAGRVNAKAVSCSANCGASAAASTGASLVGLTVSMKLVLLLSPPSETVSVIVTGPPLALAAGVTVRLRLAPLPPSTRLPAGNSAVSELEAVTDRLPAGVSASPTVKAMGPSTVSSPVDRGPIALIVGAVCVAVDS